MGVSTTAASGGSSWARPGFVLWLTGLSAAGKTTLARAVESNLALRGLTVECLDGDVVREHLSQELGFSRAHRDVNVHRVAWVAARVARAGGVVIVSLISPYAEARRRARALIETCCPFVEVYVSAPLEVCIRRDPKGLYREALAGAIADFTGVSAPYEVPWSPDLEIDTSTLSLAEATAAVLGHVERAGLVASSVALERPPEPLAAR